MILQKLAKAVAFSSIIVSALTSAQAASTVSIANNSGGMIALYAMSAANYRDSGTQVKFTGRCDSACTMFLGLPTNQTCVSSGAYFRFHSPFGVSARQQRIAQAYLMHTYPNWVRDWISSNNGLTHQLMTMDYSYASKFMRTCDTIASR